MDLMQLLKATGQQDKIIETVSKQFGLDGGQTGDAVSKILGALGGGVQKNVTQKGGMESLMGALTKGNHSQYVDQPEQAASNVSEGNNILGHLLGSKEASRDVASQIGQSTGIDADLIKKMLPMVAMMGMGAMSKGAKANGTSDGIGLDDVMSIVGALQGGKSSQGGAMGALGGIMKMMGGSR
jgi:hypothetical protein